MYLQLVSPGRDKGETRWREGIFLGARDESGELVVGSDEGKCISEAWQGGGQLELGQMGTSERSAMGGCARKAWRGNCARCRRR